MAQTGLGLAMWLRLSWDWLCGSNWPGIGYVAQIVMGLAVWLRLAWDWLCGSDCPRIGCVAQIVLGLAVGGWWVGDKMES